jgi:hypothetical protein
MKLVTITNHEFDWKNNIILNTCYSKVHYCSSCPLPNSDALGTHSGQVLQNGGREEQFKPPSGETSDAKRGIIVFERQF